MITVSLLYADNLGSISDQISPDQQINYLLVGFKAHLIHTPWSAFIIKALLIIIKHGLYSTVEGRSWVEITSPEISWFGGSPVVGGRCWSEIHSSQCRTTETINFMAELWFNRKNHLVSVILASLSLGVISWYGNKTLLWTTSSRAVTCIQRLLPTWPWSCTVSRVVW